MKKLDSKHVTSSANPNKSLVDLMSHAYTRRIKRWMFCPACREGKLSITRKSDIWKCKNCGYELSEDKLAENYAFWFCDECNAYLNNQNGFDISSNRHVCKNCGYENDTTSDNTKRLCSNCGKILPDTNGALCVECKAIRKEQTKERVINAGIILSAVVLAVATSSDKKTVADSEIDYENGGSKSVKYPTCKLCGASMSGFDGVAMYTCPDCQNKVRITENKETWYDEIFDRGKKQHQSDYALADFCHGGDLSED